MRPPCSLLAAALLLAAGSLAQAQVAMLSSSSTLDDPASILIDKANLPGDGFIVVRAETRGGRLAPGALATVAVKAGTVTDLRVPLSRPAKRGEALVVRLHADFGEKCVFEPGRDPLVLEHEVKAR
jgi:hypothetical protein